MSLLEVIIALLTIRRVVLILVPCHLELLLKRCVLVLNTGLCRLEENHNTTPKICKGPKHNRYQGNLWRGIISGFSVFSKIHLPYLPYMILRLPLYEVNNEKLTRFRSKSFSMSSYYVQLTKLLTFEGHVFKYQELSFRLPGLPFPIF